MSKGTEAFKPITGYEKLYSISNLGNVVSIKKGVLLKSQNSVNGYLQYTLSMFGKLKTYTAHKLVAEAFLTKPTSKHQINHKDGNKKNNNLENLEYLTASENKLHSIHVPGRGHTKEARRKLSNKAVRKIKLEVLVNYKKQGLSNRRIAKKLNVSYSTINNIVNGKHLISEELGGLLCLVVL